MLINITLKGETINVQLYHQTQLNEVVGPRRWDAVIGLMKTMPMNQFGVAAG